MMSFVDRPGLALKNSRAGKGVKSIGGRELRLTIDDQGVTNDEFFTSSIVIRQSLFVNLF